MINSDLQKLPFSELTNLRKYFEQRKDFHFRGYQRLTDKELSFTKDAIVDMDEMILAKYKEQTATFTEYNFSNEVGN